MPNISGHEMQSLGGKTTVSSLAKVEVKGVSPNPPVYLPDTNIALNLPTIFIGNKGSGKTFMLRKVMTLLSESPLVARIIVL
jgi:Mg-chelatase subunit ChlI